MDEIAFLQRMREVDDILAARKVSALWRPIFAWYEFTGLKKFYPLPWDANYPAYDGPNLFHEIQDWYGRHYHHHATIQTDWGNRWFLIRGEFFRARIPIVFNPTQPLDPFEFISDLPETFLALLSNHQKRELEDKFNAFFREASDINLNMTVWRSESPGPVAEFLERGWADLRDAATAFRPNDPTSVLFTIQQAAEKYLKALLHAGGGNASKDELRRRYGHDVCKILNACLVFCPSLARLESQVQLLAYDANVRYVRARVSASDVVTRMDVAYAICHACAKALIPIRKGLPGSSEAATPH